MLTDINIKFSLDKGFYKELDKLSSKFGEKSKQDLVSKIYNRIGPMLKQDAEKNFKSKGNLYEEPWQGLSESTKKEKQRLGYKKDILVRTGRLKEGFDYRIDNKEGSLQIYNKVQTRDGINLASIHDQGAILRRYKPSSTSHNRKKAGLRILTQRNLSSARISYPKPSSMQQPSSSGRSSKMKTVRYRTMFNTDIKTARVDLKHYGTAHFKSIYGFDETDVLQQDKPTVKDINKLTVRKRKSVSPVSKFLSNRKVSYTKAVKDWGRMSEKARTALTSYTIPRRVLFKVMDYQTQAIEKVIGEEVTNFLFQ